MSPEEHYPPDPAAQRQAALDVARGLATVYSSHVEDDAFYTRAMSIMIQPSRVVGTAMRLLNALFYLFVIGTISWLGAQVIDRGYPVDLLKTELVTRAVHAGDPIRVSYTVDRLRTCHVAINWTIVDGDSELHEYGPIIVEAAGPPGPDHYIRAFSTSKNLVPGEGVLRVVVAYECAGNYLQGIWPVVRLLPDVRFTILPATVQHDGTPESSR